MYQFSSVQSSVLSDSWWPHGLQHARPPCPTAIPGVYSNWSPLSRWCHPTISSSVLPFSFFLQSFPTSGSFQMSQLFTSGSQSIGVSASTSVLPMNIQDWFPLEWTGWISLLFKGLLSKVVVPIYNPITVFAAKRGTFKWFLHEGLKTRSLWIKEKISSVKDSWIIRTLKRVT